MTGEPVPAEEMADQYLTIVYTSGAEDAKEEAGADDEYLSVAAGLHDTAIDDGSGFDYDSDIELWKHIFHPGEASVVAPSQLIDVTTRRPGYIACPRDIKLSKPNFYYFSSYAFQCRWEFQSRAS